MSLAQIPREGVNWVLYISEWDQGPVKVGGLYGEVQCIMGDGHIWDLCEQTDTNENITFLQLCCWAAIKFKFLLFHLRMHSVYLLLDIEHSCKHHNYRLCHDSLYSVNSAKSFGKSCIIFSRKSELLWILVS